jgi:hypothetical protein
MLCSIAVSTGCLCLLLVLCVNADSYMSMLLACHRSVLFLGVNGGVKIIA